MGSSLYVFSGWDVSETFNVYDDSIISGSWSEKKGLSPNFTNLFNFTGYLTSAGIHCAYGNGIYVMVNFNERIYYSYNGTDWSYYTFSNYYYPNSIIFANGLFIMSIRSSSNPAVYSSDGFNWSYCNFPYVDGDDWGYGIGYNDSLGFVLFAGNIMYRSSDGITFSNFIRYSDGTIYDVYYLDGVFIGIGGNIAVVFNGTSIKRISSGPLGGWYFDPYENRLFLNVNFSYYLVNKKNNNVSLVALGWSSNANNAKLMWYIPNFGYCFYGSGKVLVWKSADNKFNDTPEEYAVTGYQSNCKFLGYSSICNNVLIAKCASGHQWIFNCGMPSNLDYVN